MLGGFAYFHGEWEKALGLYRRAQAMVRLTGNSTMDAFYMNNIGEISLEQGKLAEAAAMFTDASDLARPRVPVGCRIGAVPARRVRCGEARYRDAQDLFVESLQESQGVGGHVEVLETRARMAECLLLSGDTDGALDAVDEAMEQSRARGGISAQHALLLRIRGAALLRRGDVDGAGDALEGSLKAAAARDADYERALTLRVLARVDDRSGRGTHPGTWAESEEILDRLGVVWTPELV